MKSLLSFFKKEVLHILRDKRSLAILLLIPLILVLLFGFALTTDISKVPIAVLDNSKDSISTKLIERINASEYFYINKNAKSIDGANELLKAGVVKAILVMPSNLEESLRKGALSQIRISANSSDPNESTNIKFYLESIIRTQILESFRAEKLNPEIFMQINFLYNPMLKSAYNFVPGVMGLILFIVCTMMTAVGIVREKELGSMEVLLVSPLKPIYIILAKVMPYFILSFIIICMILLLAKYLLGVPNNGSVMLLMALSFVYCILGLSMGILISTIANTQQTAMFLSSTFVILLISLLSGMIFPIENMPKLLQIISNIVPARWYISAVRDIMLKGVGFEYIWESFAILSGMVLCCIVACILNFKVRIQ